MVLYYSRSTASDLMNMIRDDVFAAIQTKLKCVRGRNNGAAFAFPEIIQLESTDVQNLLLMHYSWNMSCTKCKYHHVQS